MKRRKLKLNHLVVILLLFNFLGHGSLLAQESVKGIVQDSDGVPIPGVTVIVSGTNRGVATDFDGNFTIEASVGEVLNFTFIGFKKISKSITSLSQPLSIVMYEDTQQLDEVVIVGYGTQKKKEVTGAVVGLKADIIAKAPVSDLGESIQGQIAGVNVQASDGRPGANANIQIRGVGSLTGKRTPLYVVDGVPYEDTPNIAPEQIQSIDVLKDGASAAVYGTRASNGVILITTKRGKKGKVEVDLNTYTGIQNITSGVPLMNSAQQMYNEEVMLEALGSEPLIFFFNPDAFKYDSDFVDEVQNNNAVVRNYVLGVNGGSESLSMNFNANYFDQEGVLVNSGFDRLSTRLNTQFTKGKFKAFVSLGLNYENTTQEPWGMYEYAVWQNPWQPSLGELSSLGENEVEIPVRNAIAYSYLSGQLQNSDKREVKSSNVAVNLDYEILDGLSFKMNLGRNTWDFRRNSFQPQYLVYDFTGDLNPTASRLKASLSESFTWTERNTLENILKFNKTFGKHTFDVTGVLSYEKYQEKQVGISIEGLPSNNTPVLGQGQSSNSPTSYDETTTLSGLMGRLQYNYDGKYLFSASVRRDGSSKFSEDNRIGIFPGFSAGWNISEENFLKDNSLIDNLKLRASYGEVGNEGIGAYVSSAVIESGVDYLFDNSSKTSGYIQRRIFSDDLVWETKISKNIGVDLAMFNNRFTFSMDLYDNERQDMLLYLTTPLSVGTNQPNSSGTYNPIAVNGGNMTNRGIELAASFKGNAENDLVWDVAATFTMNDNEVTDLNGIERGYPGAQPARTLPNADYTTFNAVGYEAGAFFLVEHDGVIKTQAELDEYRTIYSSAQLGDMKYVDQNGDNVIDDNDRVYKGSGQAEFELGLNLNFTYKGFDLFVQNYYSNGAEIFNGARYIAYAQGRHLEQLNMWSPQNSDSDVPTFRQNSTGNNVRARSDYWLEDGTYFRVRNITFGYTVPSETTSKIGLNRLRLYLTAMNPITITDYTGFDPEVGGDGLSTRGVDIGNYPVTRKFLLGLQVKF